MNDRELLEAAARAAGRKVFSYIDDPIFGSGINDGETDNGLWNPLENDGDALRLAVDLNLNVFHTGGCAYAMESDSDGCDEQKVSYYGIGDKHAATRLAIVCAAALIGRQL